MKYLQNFTHFINEAFDMNTAYPFKKMRELTFQDGRLNYITYHFTTKSGIEYMVALYTQQSTFPEHKHEYELAFKVNSMESNYDTLTGENNVQRILVTVLSILNDIIKHHLLKSIPIHIKGSDKPGEIHNLDKVESENSRDRIYKVLMRREAGNIKDIKTPGIIGYKYEDKGKDGLLLVPIKEQQTEQENEGITMFDDKQEEVM